MRKTSYYILLLISSFSLSCSAQLSQHKTNEKQSMEVFQNFISHITERIKNKSGLTDSAELKFILSHYLFTNSGIDTADKNNINLNDLTTDKLDVLKRELNSFYQFLQERQNINLAENIVAQQLRLRSDTSIYSKLTDFQKENTLIFFDRRSPDKILGYLLFMPPSKNLITTPKIWSWTLMFKFGKFVFRSVTGEEGYEYMF